MPVAPQADDNTPLNPIPVNESQKLVKSKVISNIGSLFTF